MTLSDLQTQLVAAMKARDSVRVDTVRFLTSAVKNNAINKYGADWEAKVADSDVLDAVKKLVKTHKESIDAFTKADRPELAHKEEAELKVLEEFAPKEMSDEELTSLLEPIAKAGGDFGPMMGKAMKAVAGKASGDRVSHILKSLLNS